MTAMMEHGNDGLRAQLEARLGELQAKLVGDLVAEPDANVGGTGEVRDTGDEAVVVEHTGVRAALMARDARELSDLQSALVRPDRKTTGGFIAGSIAFSGTESDRIRGVC